MKTQLYKDVQRKWRWKITASNGRRIAAATEGYENKADCVHNMKLTRAALDEFFKSEQKPTSDATVQKS